jgi:hypothetical protein
MENIDLHDPHIEGYYVILKARCLATTFHTTKPKAPPPQPAAPAGGTK